MIADLTLFIADRIASVAKVTSILAGILCNQEFPWGLRGAVAELLVVFFNESYGCCTQVVSYADIFSVTTEQLKAASAIASGALSASDVDITSSLRCLCEVLW